MTHCSFCCGAAVLAICKRDWVSQDYIPTGVPSQCTTTFLGVIAQPQINSKLVIIFYSYTTCHIAQLCLSNPWLAHRL